MKVAIGIFSYFPWGGLQYDMKSIALELVRRGAEVTVYTGEWRGEEFPDGIRVELLPLSGMSNHARALDFASKFRRAAADADIRFAFNRFGGAEYYFAADDCFAASLARKRGGVLLKLLSRYRIFSRLEREIFSPESSTHIFHIVPRQMEEFQQIYKTPAERFTLLGPGIKSSFVPSGRQAGRELLGAAPDEKVCLFIAANWHLKGGDRLMESFARLPEELRRKWRLDFIGGDGKGAAQRLAARLGITDSCHFHGPRRDVEKFLPGADVLVHPARKEAAGNVIAEALACAVPVLLTGLCGYASLVRACGAGIILPEPFEGKKLDEAFQTWAAEEEKFKTRALAAPKLIDFRTRAAMVAEKIFTDFQQKKSGF